MNIVQQPLAVILLVGAIVCGAFASSGQAADSNAQAKPIITLLKCVKEKDERQLESVFSEKLRVEFAKRGWDKVLQEYEAEFNKELGEYTMDDFAYEFSGDEETGEVSLTFKGKKFPGLRVVNENGEWKMNER
jgi:hypothetical protein